MTDPSTNASAAAASHPPGTRAAAAATTHAPPQEIQLPPSPVSADGENLSSSSPVPSPTADFLSAKSHQHDPALCGPSSRPRAPSPSRRMRPMSAGSVISVPPMQRAHSSPGVDSSGRLITPYGAVRRPSSPLHTGRRRSPLRSTIEDTYPAHLTAPSWSRLSIEPNIPEHAELDLSPSPDHDPPQHALAPAFSNTFPRARRRSGTPLHQSASAPSLHASGLSPGTSGRTSPSLSGIPQKYAYEPYPAYSFSSASSMPSTPTSVRSRSPSISSLETIEDTPDAEEAARLEEEEGKLRGDDADPSDPRRRSSLELRSSNLRSNKERKRWSVCGAERRADFSLEPIEE